jgi:hypothetical protein
MKQKISFSAILSMVFIGIALFITKSTIAQTDTTWHPNGIDSIKTDMHAQIGAGLKVIGHLVADSIKVKSIHIGDSSLIIGGNTINGGELIQSSTGIIGIGAAAAPNSGFFSFVKVGIGIDAPQHSLHINDSQVVVASRPVNMAFTGYGSGQGTGTTAKDGFQIGIQGGGGVAELKQQENKDMIFYTGNNNSSSGTVLNAERMRIVGTTGASQGNIGINTSTPDASALLHINASNKGVLIPSVALTSTSDATTVPTPAYSLLVYNTGSGGLTPAGYWYNAGSSVLPNWVQLISTATSGSWLLVGNSIADTNFLGTTNNKDLVIKTNNTEKMRVKAGGNVGIGTSAAANNKLVVVSSLGKIKMAIGSSYALSATAPTSIDSATYLHLGMGESNAGSYRLIGFGFNNAGAALPSAWIGYQQISTTGSQYGDLIFGTRSVTTNTTATERMRIAYDGNVGIGTSTPANKFDVYNTNGAIEGANIKSVVSGIIAGGATFRVDASPTPTSDISNYASAIITLRNKGTQGISSLLLGVSALQVLAFNNTTAGTVYNLSAINLNNSNTSTGNITNMMSAYIPSATNTGTGTVTNYYGNRVLEQTVGSTLNAGFASEISAGTGKFNCYMVGTAKNYFAGSVGIGLTNPAAKLDVNGTSNFTGNMAITGNVTITGSGTYSGTWTSSDQQFKTDVDSLHDALTVIRQLKPKTYYFDTVNFSEFNFSAEKSYGFIAQDIEQILPELVSSNLKPAVLDTSGNVIHPAVSYKAVNYTELIAFLTKGIQEQQQKIDSLQSKTSNQDSINTALQSNNIALQHQVNQLVANGTSIQNQLNQLLDAVNNCCSATRSMQIGSTNTQSEPLMQTDVKLRDGQALVLQQNVPNPFKENTTIKYILPESYMKAQLLFNNSQGKLIQSVELTGSGEGQLNVFADDLSSGIYTYTLVIDGKIIETKKMIKQ